MGSFYLEEPGGFRISQCQVHVLDRLASGAFAQVIDDGYNDGTPGCRIILPADVAEVGMRDCMEIGNLPGCIYPDERFGRVTPAIYREQILAGGDFFGSPEVNRFQNAAVDGDQLRGEAELLFLQARRSQYLWYVTVVENRIR